MTYAADIFFAQTWKDHRLRLPENMTQEYRLIEVDWLKNLWRPDSFFKNAKSVTFQTMTIPNHYMWMYVFSANNFDGLMSTPRCSPITIYCCCSFFKTVFPLSAPKTLILHPLNWIPLLFRAILSLILSPLKYHFKHTHSVLLKCIPIFLPTSTEQLGIATKRFSTW